MRGDFNELIAEMEQQKTRDRLLHIWNNWGNWIFAFIGALLVGTASWNIYEYSINQKRMRYSDLYEKGRLALHEKKEQEGLEVLEGIAKYGVANYRAMARMAMAEYFLANDKSDKAYEEFKKLETDSVIKPFYRGLAHLNRIKLDIENGVDKPKVLTELDTLMIQNPDLRLIIMELKGFLLTEIGEYKQARDMFVEIAQSQQTDPNTRKRAYSMIRLISAQHLDE